MNNPTPSVVRALAPTGTLRVGLNMSNFLLTRTEEDGAPAGVAPDLGRELAKRLGVAVELVPFPN
ncbi:MAG: ABC transporter substrate-binding protein, partial [Burkholderiales bacterium]